MILMTNHPLIANFYNYRDYDPGPYLSHRYHLYAYQISDMKNLISI